MYNEVASALRSGHRMQSHGIKIRFTSGCSAGLARCVLDPEVYIMVSFFDLRRGVAQWLARFVRDEEAGGSSPLTPTIFSLYIVNAVAVLPISSPLPSFVDN